MVAELLAHCDVVGTAAGTPTPSGGTPSAGTPPCGTPNVRTPSVRTPSVRTPTGGTAAPPPPPPPQLVLRYDDPLTTAFVSITNNDKPAVNCVQRTVPVAGIAARINFPVPDVNFTVTGSEETRLPAGASRGVGPATGSTFNVTVTCDNGLSTSQEKIY